MNMKTCEILLTLATLIAVFTHATGNDGHGVFPYKNDPMRWVRADTIENFDDGVIQLYSYPGEDFDSSAWALDSNVTYNNSPYSLKLWGNTWKIESIVPVTIDTNDVWQVAAYIDTIAEIQGFGLRDTAHTLLYSFAGTQLLDPDDWVTVYQGAFPPRAWNIYQLPVGQDWLAHYGYMPTITGIVFINDRDYDPDGVVYFDEVLDITTDLPMAPQVAIGYTTGKVYQGAHGTRLVDIQFYSTVVDTDSWYHDYFWYFGDDSTSNEPNPLHTYVVLDDHVYTVLLEVADSTNMWGRATCQVTVDPGPTTFPLTMNFVGDVMLARRYEYPGGIIPTLGVEAIFEPTLPHLGEVADITVANLECPLTDTGTPHPTKPIIFRGSPENVAGLVYAGIDVVSLANNHIIDYSLEGLQQTQAVLDSNGILYSGAGADAYEAYLPVFCNRKGTNVAFLASSERTGQYDNYQPYLNAGFNKPGFAFLSQFDITRQIQTVENDADIIIMEMHSGDEYNPVPAPDAGNAEDYGEEEMYSRFLTVPSRSDIEDRHHAIDQGADLVVCHHVHVLQGLEVYNGRLIAHSLGDFTFDLNYPETYPSMILNGKIDATGFYEYNVVPVYIDDYIPRRAHDELGLYILDYLARRTKDLNTYLAVDRDSVSAQIVLDTAGMISTTTTHSDTAQLQEENGTWISSPVRLHKEGDISSILSIDPYRTWQFRLGREMVWFGNFEDEGCTMWLLDHPDEFYDDSIYYRGSRSLCQIRAHNAATITTGLENRLPCHYDTAGHTLYGYIKTDNADNAEIVVRFYQSRTSSYSIGSENAGQVAGTTDWSFYYNNFIPTNGTRFIDVWLRSTGPQTDNGYAWFDDIGVIEWEDWQTFAPPHVIPTPNDYYWLQIRTDDQTSEAVLSYEEKTYSPSTGFEIFSGDDVAVSLLQCYPNPATSVVTFQYYLNEPRDVILRIFNILGQEVRTLFDEKQAPGPRTVTWDGRDNIGRILASGVYFGHLNVGTRVQTRKLILLKK
jgi:poly-gamma-glutamate capsule biosynthesis protein CapA/YwtB (metallophosphatase superfamily)